MPAEEMSLDGVQRPSADRSPGGWLCSRTTLLPELLNKLRMLYFLT